MQVFPYLMKRMKVQAYQVSIQSSGSMSCYKNKEPFANQSIDFICLIQHTSYENGTTYVKFAWWNTLLVPLEASFWMSKMIWDLVVFGLFALRSWFMRIWDINFSSLSFNWDYWMVRIIDWEPINSVDKTKAWII